MRLSWNVGLITISNWQNMNDDQNTGSIQTA